MLHVDVIVVGAGPAGAVAAQRLAASGVQVALLDQATFPRDKPCGDGVMAEGLAVLERSGLAAWLTQFQVMELLRLTSPDGQVLDIDLRIPDEHIGRLIPRRRLDAQLAQMAVEAGAHLIEGSRVRQVRLQAAAPLEVAANGFTLTAQIVILADGSHAPITHSLGLVWERPELLAIRQYLVGDDGPANRLEIHFQSSIIPGYDWLFPVGEGRVNVGTGTYTRRIYGKAVDLRHELECFVRDPVTAARLAHTEPVGPIQGHPLRTNLKATHTHAGRVLVVGDAAGLVSPFTGEGIAAALRSGELAAAQALLALEQGDFSAAALSPYSRALWDPYGVAPKSAGMLPLLLSNPALLNRVFRKMRSEADLALLFGQVFLDKKSPRLALRPTTLLRLLAG